MLSAFTIGHSTRTREEFLELVRAHEIQRVIDVRTIPRSRRHPHFSQDILSVNLRSAGVDYVHLGELGGLRHPRPDSINTGWRNASFRGYADYMQGSEFALGLQRLIDLAGEKRSAFMCAEAVPWRCHRTLIADALVARGYRVEHIMTAQSIREHELTIFARVHGTQVTYPLGPLGADEQLSLSLQH